MRRVGLSIITRISPEDKSNNKLVFEVKLGDTMRDGRASREGRSDIFVNCRQPWPVGDWIPGLCDLPRAFGRLRSSGRLGCFGSHVDVKSYIFSVCG